MLAGTRLVLGEPGGLGSGWGWNAAEIQPEKWWFTYFVVAVNNANVTNLLPLETSEYLHHPRKGVRGGAWEHFTSMREDIDQ